MEMTEESIMANPTWRGVTICTCMTAPLDELARKSGNDILVSPIPGFGSFQVGKTASAGTGKGGGHVDLSLTKLNGEQKLRLEALSRRIGFYADIREATWWSPTRKRWLRATWQSHLHMVLKSCEHLSAAAATQLKGWYAGDNGLVGADPDDGDRTFLHQTWAQYSGAPAAVAAKAPTINLANLRIGKTNNDVKRYQAAVWGRLGTATHDFLLKKHHLSAAQIADGFYGPVTVEMTTTLYTIIRGKEPKGGWPLWKQPGPRLLKRMGFAPVGGKALGGEAPDEFGEPDFISDPLLVTMDM